jgi:sialic acid synthase SpsE
MSSLKLLEKINVNTYKIASCDITNFPLIEAIAKTRKPIFLSTGASEIKEIKEAINVIKKKGNNKIVVMHCILCYPTKPRDANLNSITLLKKIFKNYPIGFSDHTLGTNITKAAIALGAVAVEKHFTINKKLLYSADHWLSIDEPELTDLVKSKNDICDAIGYEIKKPFSCELIAKKNARRSIVANKYIRVGEKYSGDNITTKRPGTGISANLYFKYLGKKSNKNYKPDDLIKK